MSESAIETDSDICVKVYPRKFADLCATGFSYDGKHIITVNHISAVKIRDEDRSPPLIKCELNDDHFYATKVGSDNENDIAVYRIEGDAHLIGPTFLDFSDPDQGRNWRISFAELHTVTGTDCDENKMTSVRNYCIVSLVTPTRYHCMGYLNTKLGFSGSPVFLEKKSKLMTVGMLSSGSNFCVFNKGISNEYIRTRKIHEVVQNIIKRSAED